MSTRREVLAGATATLALASPGLRAAARAATTRLFTAADVHPAKYPTVAAVQWAGHQLSEQTGGRIDVRVYHSGQLGRETDTVDLARFGALDIARVNFASINNTFPLTRVAVLPFVFDSIAHMRRANDGAPGRTLLEGFGSRGLIGLALYDSGTRCVYNRLRPVHEPADLHGMKLRVPPSDVFIKLMHGLGANPTPLAFGEVYSALQTHLIDGGENNIKSFDSSRHFEAARFWSETRHSYSPEALVMSRARFDGLAVQDRELVLATFAQSVPYMRGLWDAAEQASRAAVLAAGIAMNEVDIAAFRAASQGLLAREITEAPGRKLYEAIRACA